MKKSYILLLLVLCIGINCIAQDNRIYPSDMGILNVLNYGAVPNDGLDDTQAIQNALNAQSTRHVIVYLPNGTYNISNTLSFPVGDWGGSGNHIQGQSQAGVIIKLNDNAAGFGSAATEKIVFDASTASTSYTSNAFHNYVEYLTIDVGSGNPGATGLAFYSNNSGAVRNVTIKAGGAAGIGLHLYELSANGPLLVKNVSVQGFTYGIYEGGAVNGATFENITLAGQSLVGFYNDGGPLSIRRLISNNTVTAFEHNGDGHAVLIDCQLNGGSSSNNAIYSHGNSPKLFVRNINATGYAKAVKSTVASYAANTEPAGLVVTEWSSFGPQSTFTNAGKSLSLSIQETPDVPWDVLSNWVNVQTYGANPADNSDDTQAIQNAIDAGKSTVYFPTGGKATYPSGYSYKINTIYVRGNVSRLIGGEAGFSGVVNYYDPSYIVIDPVGPSPVIIEQLGLGSYVVVNNSTSRTVIIKGAEIGTYNGTGTGTTYLEDLVGRVNLTSGHTLFARQHNPEGFGGGNVVVDNSSYWCLGLKSEGGQTIVDAKNNSKVEILGGNFYSTQANSGNNPMMKITDSQMSFSIPEACFSGFSAYTNYVMETRSGVTNYLTAAQCLGHAGTGKSIPLYLGNTQTFGGAAVTGVSISPATASVGIGSTITLVATVSPANASNKNVAWSTSNSAVATVSNLGVATGIGAGTVTITATTLDGAKTSTSSVTVSNVAVTGVTMSPSSANISQGGTLLLVATIAPSNATNQNKTWSSNNTAVATVNSAGVVTGVSQGTANITVTTADGAKTATCAITISAPNLALNATGYRWFSNSSATGNTNKTADTGINDGILTDVALGGAEFTANMWQAGGVIWSTSQTLTKIEFIQGSFGGGANDDGDFTANFKLQITTNGSTWADATGWTLSPAYQYNSAAVSGATFTFTGSATVLGVRVTGQVNTPSGGSWFDNCREVRAYNSTSSTIAVTGVTVSPTTASTNVGATTTLTATVSPSNASNQSVTWSSSNNSIATVSSTGVVTGVASGTATITVTTVDGAKTATCIVTVNNIAVTGVTVSPTTASINVGSTSALTATVSPANATNKNVTWSSSNTAIATVNSSGVVTGVAAGSTTITVTTVDGAKTANCSVTVTNISVTGVTLSPTTASILVGATATLTATISPANATNKNVTWSSSNTAAATVSSTGVVTGVAAGASTITVTTVDGAKTATCAVTVSVATATNVAPNGTAYRWYGNTSSTSNSRKTAAAGLNDTDITTDIALGGADVSNAYQAAGVIWATAQTITKVEFIQGTYAGGPDDDGCFEANFKLQQTTNGTAWTDATGWTLTPTYQYKNAAVSGATFAFTGSASVLGIRVTGQVHTGSNGSWYDNAREVRAYTGGSGARIGGTSVQSADQAVEAEDSSVDVYPNPTSGILTIKVAGRSGFKFSIIDAKGQSVSNGQAGSSAQVDLSPFAHGLYLLKVIMQEKVIIRKIILK